MVMVLYRSVSSLPKTVKSAKAQSGQEDDEIAGPGGAGTVAGDGSNTFSTATPASAIAIPTPLRVVMRSWPAQPRNNQHLYRSQSNENGRVRDAGAAQAHDEEDLIQGDAQQAQQQEGWHSPRR